MNIRLGNSVPDTDAEGPGRRYAIWVQGCPIRCPGCCNPELFNPKGGNVTSISDLVARVLAQPGIEGVTLLGGEPMAQAQALIPFAKAIREAGLSVIVFSGYRREQMLHLPHAEELLQNIDTLVDGQYDKTQPEDTRRWIGSKNQRLFYLTDRYSDKDFMGVKDTVEIRWDGKSKVTFNGWPIPELSSRNLNAPR